MVGVYVKKNAHNCKTNTLIASLRTQNKSVVSKVMREKCVEIDLKEKQTERSKNKNNYISF